VRGVRRAFLGRSLKEDIRWECFLDSIWTLGPSGSFLLFWMIFFGASCGEDLRLRVLSFVEAVEHLSEIGFQLFGGVGFTIP
jgi:hypothetical protein